MAANDLWNGWRATGALAANATLTNGVVNILDASAPDSCKYERFVRARGGDVVEFSVFARAISGTAHIYSDLETIPNLIADLDVTGHTDWRKYTLRFVVPLSSNDAQLNIGVGTYGGEVGEAEFRLPGLKINGTVLAGATRNGWRQAGNDIIRAVTGDADRAQISAAGVLTYQATPGTFPPDPIFSAEDALSIGGVGNGRLKIHHSNTDSVLLSRGPTSTGPVARFFWVAGAASNANVGSISIDATTTTYNTSSDETLKDDDGEMSIEDAIQIVSLWKFHDFKWKSTGAADHGVFAQELYKVYPRAVTPGGWQTEMRDGVEIEYYQPWSVDYSKLVTPIGRAMQGVITKQDDLDARLRRLEGNNK